MNEPKIGTPCENEATCLNTYGSFNCMCDAGYTGNLCDEDNNECASEPCLHGGTCADGVNQYKCICLRGWDGQNCDECSLNLCKSCLDEKWPAVCHECVAGYAVDNTTECGTYYIYVCKVWENCGTIIISCRVGEAY